MSHRGLPKKSSRLLKQQLTSERRTVKNKGLGEILSRFQVRPQLGKQLKILLCTLLHSASLADPTRRVGQRRPQDPSTPTRRKKEIQPTHPELSQNMYSLSSQALRRRAPCSGPATASHKYIDTCQCTAPQRATELSLHNNGPTKNLSKNWNCSNTTASMN